MNFRDKFWFLSNMYPTPVKLNLDGKDYTFNNAEAAFQAQKDISRANEFVGLDGVSAKRLGRQVSMRPDWNTYRDTAMQNALNAKFSNADLMMMLKNVEGLIQEDNTWNDTYWGVSNGVGQNKLGQMLMNIRDSNNSNPLEDVKRFSISFTGHRPKDLPSEFGYDYNSPAWRTTIDKTKDGIKYYKPTQVITGMALGYDQAALIAANELRKEGVWNGKIIGDLPFPESGKGMMSDKQWQGYLDMLDEINYLSNGYTGNKQIYQDRNEQ